MANKDLKLCPADQVATLTGPKNSSDFLTDESQVKSAVLTTEQLEALAAKEKLQHNIEEDSLRNIVGERATW